MSLPICSVTNLDHQASMIALLDRPQFFQCDASLSKQFPDGLKTDGTYFPIVSPELAKVVCLSVDCEGARAIMASPDTKWPACQFIRYDPSIGTKPAKTDPNVQLESAQHVLQEVFCVTKQTMTNASGSNNTNTTKENVQLDGQELTPQVPSSAITIKSSMTAIVVASLCMVQYLVQ